MFLNSGLTFLKNLPMNISINKKSSYFVAKIGPIFSIILPATSTVVHPAVLNGVPLYFIPLPSL